MLDRLHAPQAGEAWHWLIERYRPFARAVLRQILSAHGRENDVEAAVGEFWGYLYTSRVFERVDRERRFRSFLAGTIRNFARDFCRRNAARGGGLDPDFDPVAPVDLPEDREVRAFANQVLQVALAELGSRHTQSAMVLRWFYGVANDNDALAATAEPIPVTEIARRMQLKPNAVHQLLHRGRKRLRAHIEAELRETVAQPEDLEDEICMILRCLNDDRPGLTTR